MADSKFIDHGFKPGGYAFFDIESLEIAQWCADDKAELPPSQVHMEIKIKGQSTPLIMRFKSPDTLGTFIEQLARHRREVWPNADQLTIS